MGNGSTISGQNQRRIFWLGSQVFINNITLINGRTTSNGGAIRVDAGKLTLEDCVIRNSQADLGGGIIVTNATVIINRCAIRNNTSTINGGGGIALRPATSGSVVINRSAIYDNTVGSNGNGGGIYIHGQSSAQNFTFTINNSSIFGNSARSGGGIHLNRSTATLTLNHATITGNSARRGVPGGPGILVSDGTLVMRNSIIAGNTYGNCRVSNASDFTAGNRSGNLIGVNSHNCPSAAGVTAANVRLASSSAGDPPYYALEAGSSAIDAAGDCTSITTVDQRGYLRPHGSACDIGAYEYGARPPAPPPRRTGGGSGGSSDDEAMPTAVAVIRYSPAQSCQTLQPSIVVSKASSGTSCQRVQGSGIGHADVIAANPSLVVDIWGWVTPGTQVCFRAGSGSIKFIDTTAMPRTVADLSVFSEPGGLLCATIDGAGQVALVAGPPAPSVATPSLDTQLLADCMVRTKYSLNFRASPGGDKIGGVPHNATLTALERTDGWFKVDYHGAKGWISAAYVEPIGTCG